jgi:uncharacterized membrane protein YoaK (UPF0700 family)
MTNGLAQAGRILVLGADEDHGPLIPFLLTLTIVTGFIDAFSYLVLGRVFVPNMTGNIVFLGFALAGASGFSIGASLSALGAFCLGAVVGGYLARSARDRRVQLLAFGSGVEALLVAAALAVSATTGPEVGWARYVLILLLGLAMGTQNAVALKLAVPDLTTTVLTLTLTGLFADRPAMDVRAIRRLGAVLAMFGGCLAGAYLVLEVNRSVAVAIPLALLALVAVACFALYRTDSIWSHRSNAN